MFGSPVAHGNATGFVVSGAATMSAVKLQESDPGLPFSLDWILGAENVTAVFVFTVTRPGELETRVGQLRITAPIPPIAMR